MRSQLTTTACLILLSTFLFSLNTALAGPTTLGDIFAVVAGEDPDVAVDSNGDLHFAYVRGFQTFYVKVTNPQGNPVAGPEYYVGEGRNPQIALDSNNQPHIMFATAFYSYWTGSGFSTPVRAFEGWRKNLIEIDSQDRVYLVGDIASPRDVVLKIYQNGAELTPFPIDMSQDNPGGMDIDENDVLHLITRWKGVHEYSRYKYPDNGQKANPYREPVQSGTSDFSWCTVDPEDQTIHYFGTVGFARGIFHRARNDNGPWGGTRTFAEFEAQAEDGDFVNPASDADMNGYKYCSFAGRDHDGYFIVLDSADNYLGVFRIDPVSGTKAGAKLTNPNVASRPDMTGAYVTWGTGTVLVRSIGDISIGGGKMSPMIAQDFDGDGLDDVAAYDNGTWHIRGSDDGGFLGYRGSYFGYSHGGPGDVPVPGDYDGDGKSDPAVYLGVTNSPWFIYSTQLGGVLPGSILLGGNEGDTPVPADYDGDGRTDPAVWDENGTWHIARSTAGYTGQTLGNPGNGDKPVPGDYDGDGAVDLAVFQPNGVWHISGTTSGYWGLVHGKLGDIPIPADYDGDGRTDIAVFDPNTALWNLRVGTDFGFGVSGDLPVPGRFFATNRATAGIFRGGEWHLFMNAPPRFGGGPNDYPIPGQWDDDGNADIAIFRNSDAGWNIKSTKNGLFSQKYGLPGDWGVPGDYDNDGILDQAVFRGGTWFVKGSNGGNFQYALGSPGDIPVQADYDNDGITDVAVYETKGVWHINGSTEGYRGFAFGGFPGDQPLALDVDGDNRPDSFILDNNSTWHGIRSSNSSYIGFQWGNPDMYAVVGDFTNSNGVAEQRALYDANSRTFYVYPGNVMHQLEIGFPGMVPVVADYDGDGITDYAAFNSATGEWFIRNSSDGSFRLTGDTVTIIWGAGATPIGVRTK